MNFKFEYTPKSFDMFPSKWLLSSQSYLKREALLSKTHLLYTTSNHYYKKKVHFFYFY